MHVADVERALKKMKVKAKKFWRNYYEEGRSVVARGNARSFRPAEAHPDGVASGEQSWWSAKRS